MLLLSTTVLLYAVLRVRSMLKQAKDIQMNVSYMSLILAMIAIINVIWIAELIQQNPYVQSCYYLGELLVEIIMIVILWQVSGQNQLNYQT